MLNVAEGDKNDTKKKYCNSLNGNTSPRDRFRFDTFLVSIFETKQPTTNIKIYPGALFFYFIDCYPRIRIKVFCTNIFKIYHYHRHHHRDHCWSL